MDRIERERVLIHQGFDAYPIVFEYGIELSEDMFWWFMHGLTGK